MPVSASQLSELIETHAASLRLWVQARGGAAEDVVQEAFCRLGVEEPSPARPVPWLYRVCRNLTEKQRLSDRRRRRREEARASNELVHLDPAERLEMDEVLSQVEALDPDLRQVLIARIWGELSLDDVASICGISTTTAFRRYHSALKVLRSRLEAKCNSSN